MTTTTKVFTVAHVPNELRQAWLQHLRDFDTAHPGCHFEVMADAPDASVAEMVELLRVEPGLTFQEIIERKPVVFDGPGLLRDDGSLNERKP
jgi:hypothetical protein